MHNSPGSAESDPHSELPTDPDVTDPRPLHLRPSALLWVFGGGIVGTGLRFWVEELLPHDPTQWPWGTFLVNLVGAFLLGTLLEGLARAGDDAGWRQRVRLFAGTGGCGAFTTYSTLSLEVSMLGRHADIAVAAAYGLASVVAGALMAWLGIVTAAEAHRRRTPA
ncbi:MULTISPECIES: fluoride efflux transporter FluC [Mycolicibacterium]|uniref:Fluoride-specific ion channel FluC n=1 Tax=Mycolicibacterium austroafricanum TaxID=39687 RepID=A0ABT8HHX9_MYCAO|nr:CrcB family protein [Mycolicibacterium austroafricanum]MDN4520377.1 CrcB family protein [Mycolicibacterium austroafricanum]